MDKNPIVFLPLPLNAVPKNAREFVQKHSGPNLVPVELDNAEAGIITGNDTGRLRPEMILTGMLRIIAARGKTSAVPQKPKQAIKSGDLFSEPEEAGVPPEWIDFYRGFVLTAKPEIYHEFTGASIVKAGNGDFGMALEISAVLEGLFPGSPGVLLNSAQILELKAASLEKKGHSAEKENAETLALYESALSMEQVLPDTFFNSGFFFLRMRDYARARDCFTRYLSLGNDSGIPAEKKKQARKIVQDIGSHGLDDASYREAYDCISRGNDEEGLQKIREFIEKHPKVWNGWFMLGWALRKSGRYADALESFKKAVELGGSGTDIRNETAICLMESNDLKGARRELEAALGEEPENIKIISNLGVLAMKSGNKSEAEAFFRTVLELDPEDPLAKWGMGE